MLKKTYSRTGQVCRATFIVPSEVGASSVYLVGDFNEWDMSSIPMRRYYDGSFSITLSLDANNEYRFRYWLDGQRWENDWSADAYAPNGTGTDDSVIRV